MLPAKRAYLFVYAVVGAERAAYDELVFWELMKISPGCVATIFLLQYRAHALLQARRSVWVSRNIIFAQMIANLHTHIYKKHAYVRMCST